LTNHNTATKASTIMPPIGGGTRRTRARQVRQAAIRNEFEETFSISAEGQDLSQYVDHDNSDDNFNLEEEGDNADDTQIGQRLVDIRNNKILFDSTFSAVQQPGRPTSRPSGQRQASNNSIPITAVYLLLLTNALNYPLAMHNPSELTAGGLH
jgi:hypothetical protein